MPGELDGMAEVQRNLNRAISDIEGQSMAGLMAGGLIVQRAAQKNVPVEYGNLKASAYTRKEMGGAPTVEIGFTADYAVYVHENTAQKLKGQPRPSGLGVYWGPAGGPKFLERAMTETSRKVLDAVASYARRA